MRSSARSTEERKKREIDPTLSVLRHLTMEPRVSPRRRSAQERIREMTETSEVVTTWYDDVKRLDAERLAQLVRLGAGVQKVLDIKDRLAALPGLAQRRKPVRRMRLQESLIDDRPRPRAHFSSRSP